MLALLCIRILQLSRHTRVLIWELHNVFSQVKRTRWGTLAGVTLSYRENAGLADVEGGGVWGGRLGPKNPLTSLECLMQRSCMGSECIRRP